MVNLFCLVTKTSEQGECFHENHVFKCSETYIFRQISKEFECSILYEYVMKTVYKELTFSMILSMKNHFLVFISTN